MAKKVTGWLSSVVLVLVLYLFLWPVPIDPIAWEPHPAKGLLSIDPNGSIKVLCTEAGYHPTRLIDDVDVDSQNVARFSDASYKWNYQQWMSDALESAPNGRLLKYDINTGECSVVLDGLFFANGIAVSPDETYVLVNETTRYRWPQAMVAKAAVPTLRRSQAQTASPPGRLGPRCQRQGRPQPPGCGRD